MEFVLWLDIDQMDKTPLACLLNPDPGESFGMTSLNSSHGMK